MPADAGAGFEFTPILEAARAVHGSTIIVISNLSRAGGKTATDHAVSSAGWLSGAIAKQTEAAGHPPRHHDRPGARRSRSARTRRSRRSSSPPRTSPATSAAACPGYSCTYMNTISWAGETAPLPMEINPRVVVRADVRPRRRRGAARRRAMQRGPQHPRLDRRRSARAAAARSARRTARGSTTISTTCARSSGASSGREAQQRRRRDVAGAPIGVPETFEEHAALMFDLLAVAYQADLTRVFTFMMAREASQRTYPGARDHRDASRHVASRQPARQDGAAREDQRALHVSCSRRSSSKLRRLAGRRRHRCSITR